MIFTHEYAEYYYNVGKPSHHKSLKKIYSPYGTGDLLVVPFYKYFVPNGTEKVII
jgi:hypothetical protein